MSGRATACDSRSRISRERGPGISVRSEMTRVAAMLCQPTRRAVRRRRHAPRMHGQDLERDLDPDPIAALRSWLDDAEGATARPDAMTLATATADGRPSARVVLLRGVDD